MATAVTIIDIDLGIDINEIIGDKIRGLTKQNEADIEQALEQSRAIKELSTKKLKEQSAQQTAMGQAFTVLVQAKEIDRKVPWVELAEIVKPITDNPNSFSLRMRAYLRKEGRGMYRMVSRKVNKQLAYLLLDYNGPDAQAEDAPEAVADLGDI